MQHIITHKTHTQHNIDNPTMIWQHGCGTHNIVMWSSSYHTLSFQTHQT